MLIIERRLVWTQADGGVPYPENKYFDLYQSGADDDNYNRRILGDATGELGPFGNKNDGGGNRHINSWDADEAWFIGRSNPWFIRGGTWNLGTGTGVFTFNNANGNANGNNSFRVLTI